MEMEEEEVVHMELSNLSEVFPSPSNLSDTNSQSSPAFWILIQFTTFFTLSLSLSLSLCLPVSWHWTGLQLGGIGDSLSRTIYVVCSPFICGGFCHARIICFCAGLWTVSLVFSRWVCLLTESLRERERKRRRRRGAAMYICCFIFYIGCEREREIVREREIYRCADY